MCAVWKSAFWFALVGPPVGLAIILAIPVAGLVWNLLVGRQLAVPADGPAAWTIAEMLLLLPVYLIGAYFVGGPAAFAAGAVRQLMADRAYSKLSIAAANIVVAAGIAMLTVYALDTFVVPHPHLDAAPMFGPRIWLSVGAVAAISAAICTLAPSRGHPIGKP